jgi:hypothetical protein
MASGKIWSGVLPADSYQDTGATPVGMVRTVSINAVNFGTASTTLSVYIGTSASPGDGDRIEPDVTLEPNDLYKVTGEIVGAGERVVVKAVSASVAVRVTCFEETAL